MPQMCSMNWLMLMLYFLIIYLFLMILIYFKNLLDVKNKKFGYQMNNLKLKWY